MICGDQLYIEQQNGYFFFLRNTIHSTDGIAWYYICKNITRIHLEIVNIITPLLPNV